MRASKVSVWRSTITSADRHIRARLGDDGQLRAAFMDQLERVTVAAHFFFVAVAQGGFAEEERGNAGLVHLHAFDAVGRLGALNDGCLAEGLQHLRRLVRDAEAFGEGAARELILSVSEGEHAWTGGQPRHLLRADVPEELAGALFAAQPGELIGPRNTR